VSHILAAVFMDLVMPLKQKARLPEIDLRDGFFISEA